MGTLQNMTEEQFEARVTEIVKKVIDNMPAQPNMTDEERDEWITEFKKIMRE